MDRRLPSPGYRSLVSGLFKHEWMNEYWFRLQKKIGVAFCPVHFEYWMWYEHNTCPSLATCRSRVPFNALDKSTSLSNMFYFCFKIFSRKFVFLKLVSLLIKKISITEISYLQNITKSYLQNIIKLYFAEDKLLSIIWTWSIHRIIREVQT